MYRSPRFVVSERFHYPIRIVERSKCDWAINPAHLSHPHTPAREAKSCMTHGCYQATVVLCIPARRLWRLRLDVVGDKEFFFTFRATVFINN
jgi:hypothetical protein